MGNDPKGVIMYKKVVVNRNSRTSLESQIHIVDMAGLGLGLGSLKALVKYP